MRIIDGAKISGEVKLYSLAKLQDYAGVLVVDEEGKVYKATIESGGSNLTYYYYHANENVQPYATAPGQAISNEASGNIYLYQHGIMQTGSYRVVIDFHFSVNHIRSTTPADTMQVAASRRVEFNICVDPSGSLNDYASDLKVTQHSGVWLRRVSNAFHSTGELTEQAIKLELDPYPAVGQPEYYKIKITNQLVSELKLPTGTYPMYTKYTYTIERFLTSATSQGFEEGL